MPSAWPVEPAKRFEATLAPPAPYALPSEGLTALETEYHQTRFRSRLEAHWAVYFDHCGIAWDYEPQGYDLGGVWYLPDFWLPQVGMWAEVKPVSLNEREMEKAQRLATASHRAVLLLVGPPAAITYGSREPDLTEEDYCVSNYHDYHVTEGRFFACSGSGAGADLSECGCDDEVTDEAIRAASMRRF
ncbi:MAG: hypothetical protein H0U66_06660 [Gemmatimonadaceae bacterium]|nr:hypothetical protein [Gemmatimonadaceae bacterium]